MTEQMMLLGLPAKTWLIVGGLYIVAAFLPTIIAVALSHAKKEEDNE